jgi:hypothetical protein
MCHVPINARLGGLESRNTIKRLGNLICLTSLNNGGARVFTGQSRRVEGKNSRNFPAYLPPVVTSKRTPSNLNADPVRRIFDG